MKIDPLPSLRAHVVARINAHFNRIASDHLHRDHAWRRKREVAATVLAGATLPLDHAFRREAALRGGTPRQLAQTIANKPDTIDSRELDRQRLLLKAEAAAAPAALDQILSELEVK